MHRNNLNDSKKVFDGNINNAEDENKTESREKIAPIGRNLCIALVALCVVNIIAHLACYSRLPENVPIHWGADGSVNGYGPRAVTLILDILPLLCLGLFLIIPKMDPKGESYMKASGLYRGFVIAFTLIMCGITWFTEATAFGVIPATGGPVGLIVSVVLGALFVGLGNYLPRMRQNYTFGVRTPWALADETNWKRTQRVGGISFMVLGVLLVVAGVVSSVVPVSDVLMAAIIATIAVGAALVPYVYSYLLFRRSRGSRQN